MISLALTGFELISKLDESSEQINMAQSGGSLTSEGEITKKEYFSEPYGKSRRYYANFIVDGKSFSLSIKEDVFFQSNTLYVSSVKAPDIMKNGVRIYCNSLDKTRICFYGNET